MSENHCHYLEFILVLIALILLFFLVCNGLDRIAAIEEALRDGSL